MQAFDKKNTPSSWLLIIILLVLLVSLLLFIFSKSSPSNPARFSVIDVSIAQSANNSVDLLSRFQLSLSSTAYEAIDHGVPIDIVLSYAEPQRKIWWKNYKKLGETTFRLSRHTLSNNYQLRNLSAFQTYQFITIDEALKHIAIVQLKNIEESDVNKIAVRAHLDIFKLPAQIRASAFFSSRWHHDSSWTVWSFSQ